MSNAWRLKTKICTAIGTHLFYEIYEYTKKSCFTERPYIQYYQLEAVLRENSISTYKTVWVKKVKYLKK